MTTDLPAAAETSEPSRPHAHMGNDGEKHTENLTASVAAFQSSSLKYDVRTVVSGLLMGAADIVPGVSGGTVALIVGVYERLITAISRCNATFLGLLLSRDWKAAAKHIDLRFVAALALGILTGIAGLASLMNYLLVHEMSYTFAAFSGMILASSVLVGRRVCSWNMPCAGLLIAGIVIALRLVTLEAMQNPPDTLWYMFLCGMIGITAMILPGISGAFILLLLGRYEYITGSIKGILHGDISLTVLLSLAVFAVGCLTGLLSFSRVLRWLLKNYSSGTMALLCGFMIGSLYKLWPFQRDLTPAVEKFKLKTFENYLPQTLDADVLKVAALYAAGLVAVLLLDVVANRNGEAGKPADA